MVQLVSALERFHCIILAIACNVSLHNCAPNVGPRKVFAFYILIAHVLGHLFLLLFCNTGMMVIKLQNLVYIDITDINLITFIF